jgi:hypothetical protein
METQKTSCSVSLPKLPMNIGDLDIPSSLVEDLILRRLYTQPATASDLCPTH